MLGARSYCEIVAAFAHCNTAQDSRFECPLLTPQNKRDLRQHRQHRLHEQCLFSDPSQDGLIGSGPMTGGSTDGADGTDGIFKALHRCLKGWIR
jgi:hypothetical protein